MIPSKYIKTCKVGLMCGSLLLTAVLLTNTLLNECHENVYMAGNSYQHRTRYQIAMSLLSRDIDEDVPYHMIFNIKPKNTTSHLQVDIPANLPQIPKDGSDFSVLKRVKGFSYDLFMFSAVVGNSSASRPWDTIVIQGWEHHSYENRTFGCCIKYVSGRFESVKKITKIHWSYKDRTQMPVKQYVCKSDRYVQGDVPELVTLSGTSSKTSCHRLYNWYIKPTFAYENKDKIAVCAKLAYGSLPADEILSWFEIHRLLGMDKALLYTYNLNEEAEKVLQYYWSIGLADIVPFTLPRPSRSRKKVDVGVKNYQAWNDEQIPVFDCLEKLRGYKYVVVLDIDEYLIPKSTKSWMELFDSIYKSRPKAAGFNFLVQLHVTSWGVTNPASKFKIGQYQNRTLTMTDRMKHVTKPERLQQGGLSTHIFQPRWDMDYHRFRCTETEAVIHHFRSCRKDWMKSGHENCYDMERITDTTVSDLLADIEYSLLELKYMLFRDV